MIYREEVVNIRSLFSCKLVIQSLLILAISGKALKVLRRRNTVQGPADRNDPTWASGLVKPYERERTSALT